MMRGVRWPFVILFLGLCAIAETSFGSSVPESVTIPQEDPKTQREFQNVYQAIKNPTMGTATISTGTISSLSASTVTVTSATITNLTVTNGVTGSVIQTVISTGTTRTGAITATSFAATVITGSITPLFATSRIRVTAVSSWTPDSTCISYLTLFRGTSTNMAGSTATSAFLDSNSGGGEKPFSLMWPDSPATTSATSYTVYSRVGASGCSNNSFVNQNQATWTVILEEIHG